MLVLYCLKISQENLVMRQFLGLCFTNVVLGLKRNYFDHKICRSVLKKYTSKFIFGSHVPYADWVIINLIYYLIQHEDFLSLQHPASVICAKLLGKYKETLREFYAESAFLNFFSILCKNKVSNN